MASASGGYVTDVEYTAGFIPETSPAQIAFAMLCAKRSPAAALRPRRVLELGFGQGFGLALLAAANPHVEFEGCDVNPAHVAHARTLAEDAGLANLTLRETSFDALAAAEGAADADVIVAHGVLSWVGASERAALLAIVRRRLAPGGLVYVSYNCFPGAAALLPLRRVMLEVSRARAGGSREQVELALAKLVELRQAHALYFRASPFAAAQLDAMLGMDRAYLAHEFLSEDGGALAFADVAREMRELGLGHAASATLPENIPALAVHDAAREVLARTDDPLLRDTLLDFAVNKAFRRDLYARDAIKLAPAAWDAAMASLRFELVAPRERTVFEFEGPLGKLAGKPDIYAPVADRLARESASFADLLALPPFEGTRRDMLLECLALLVHSAQVMPRVDGAPCDAGPAQRFNRVIAQRARGGRAYGYLAAPRVASGIPVNELDLKVFGAPLAHERPALPAERTALEIWRGLGAL